MALLGRAEHVAAPKKTVTPVDSIQYPAIAAHRGGATVHPESTVEAFRAIVRDYPGMVLEMDVHALSDGTLVVWHDTTIDRLAEGGKTGNVGDLTRKDWENLWVKHPQGGRSAPAAFLNDVLEEFGGTGVVLMIELKHRKSIDRLIEAVWAYRDQVILCAFHSYDAGRFSRTDGINGQHLFSEKINTAFAPGAQCIAVNYRTMTPEIVKDIHAANAYAWAWTVNDQPTIDRMLAMGVDGIITDDPRLTVT